MPLIDSGSSSIPSSTPPTIAPSQPFGQQLSTAWSEAVTARGAEPNVKASSFRSFQPAINARCCRSIFSANSSATRCLNYSPPESATNYMSRLAKIIADCVPAQRPRSLAACRNVAISWLHMQKMRRSRRRFARTRLPTPEALRQTRHSQIVASPVHYLCSGLLIGGRRSTKISCPAEATSQ